MKSTQLLFFFAFFNCVLVNAQTVSPALEVLSTYSNVRDLTLSANGLEAYVSVQSPLSEVSVIVQLQKNNGVWSSPTLVSFSGNYNDLEPFLAPNGLRLYFASNRPTSDTATTPKDFDIWYVERSETTKPWGEPINLGAPVNSSYNEFYPAISQHYNLYFTSDRTGSKGKDDIFYSAFEKNNYMEPVSLSDSINSAGYEFNAFVSPNESYLIFTGYNRTDGLGSGDLYISFKGENQTWSKAVSLGENINSKYMDYCPFVDEQASTLYFTSKRSTFNDSYQFKTIEDVLQEINKSENGQSRIYQVPFNPSDYLKH
ncbi:MAG: hypothetical protein AB7O47_01700 [Flavobacteriales bacterium]